MYDIIGDIHGHADELRELLELMGYKHRGKLHAHPDRQAVFVGDFIDRGSQISEVLQIVRPMIDNGHAVAVMGNHEFNAIAYHTPDPANRGQFLREHNNKNDRQHAETVRQLTAGQLSEAIMWFRSLPMSLDLDGIRVVHACWDIGSINVIERALAEHDGLSTDFMLAATRKSEDLCQSVEDVLKGKELTLPNGISFKDKDGHERSEVRTKWYEHPAGKTYREYTLPAIEEVPDEPVPESAWNQVTQYNDDADPPVFVGHYWLRAERPTLLAPNVACVDYSVAKGGNLCAYRWDGEQELSAEKFVWVNAR